MSSSPRTVLREMRLAAGFSQRELARRGGTSQPAIARYERGVAVPSWDTLQRLAAACGHRLDIRAGVIPDQHDVDLTQALLKLTPGQRLRTLRRYARLRRLAEVRND